MLSAPTTDGLRPCTGRRRQRLGGAELSLRACWAVERDRGRFARFGLVGAVGAPAGPAEPAQAAALGAGDDAEFLSNQPVPVPSPHDSEAGRAGPIAPWLFVQLDVALGCASFEAHLSSLRHWLYRRRCGLRQDSRSGCGTGRHFVRRAATRPFHWGTNCAIGADIESAHRTPSWQSEGSRAQSVSGEAGRVR